MTQFDYGRYGFTPSDKHDGITHCKYIKRGQVQEAIYADFVSERDTAPVIAELTSFGDIPEAVRMAFCKKYEALGFTFIDGSESLNQRGVAILLMIKEDVPTDPIEILSLAQHCSDEPSTLNYFQPLARLFGVVAHGQDFEEPMRGSRPEEAAMLVKANELAQEHLAQAWASAFHLACVTDRLDAFEQALASSGYFCAWAPLTLPREDLVAFLRADDGSFEPRMSALFRLARHYSTGSGVVLPGLAGAEALSRESAVCAELANRLMVDVGMGRKKLNEETQSHYRRAVEIFIESFNPEHIKEALEEVVSMGRHHRERHPNFFAHLEAVEDLLPEVSG